MTPSTAKICRQGLRSILLSGAAALCVVLLAMPAKSNPPGFADLVERVNPAVVHIDVQVTLSPGSGDQFLPDRIPEEFRDWFRLPPDSDEKDRSRSSRGSGFIIDPAGYIVTNHHVINGVDSIAVTFEDGESLDATVIGSDSKTDIALLKVEPNAPLPFVRFGDSDTARIGDWVVAIGSPFGLGGSVSVGIISARNRDINSGPYDDYIQTDAAINRGNSGGPLFNLDGDVIGVNSAIISPSGVSAGIGFAVPSALASNVVRQLREHGRTRRGWLGVAVQQVTDEIAESDGLDEAAGAMVSSVITDGPADNAGVEVGDIILEFDGSPVEEWRDLPRMVAETEVGRTVRLKVWRGERFQTLGVELGLLQEDEGEEVQVASAEPEELEKRVASLGIEVVSLDDDLRSEHEYDDTVSGVLIVSVDSGSWAEQQGIQEGTVIEEVNRQKVTTPEEVSGAVARAVDAGRRSVLLLVNTKGIKRYIGVRIDS